MDACTFFQDVLALPFRSLRDVCESEACLIIAPHPDDESLGCGGLISEAVLNGYKVWIIIITDGTGSHRNSQSYPPSRLKEVRKNEALSAAQHLGVAQSNVIFLDLADGLLPNEGATAAWAAKQISDIANYYASSALFVTWEHDPHEDHRAASKIAKLAKNNISQCELFEYPIWGWQIPADEQISTSKPDGFRLDIRVHAAKKKAAIHSHRSQLTSLISDDPQASPLSEEMLNHFIKPYEVFLRVDS